MIKCGQNSRSKKKCVWAKVAPPRTKIPEDGSVRDLGRQWRSSALSRVVGCALKPILMPCFIYNRVQPSRHAPTQQSSNFGHTDAFL